MRVKKGLGLSHSNLENHDGLGAQKKNNNKNIARGKERGKNNKEAFQLTCQKDTKCHTESMSSGI